MDQPLVIPILFVIIILFLLLSPTQPSTLNHEPSFPYD